MLIDIIHGPRTTNLVESGGTIAHMPKRLNWRRVIERLVLGLSDQQLVTGIAILSVGVYRIPASRGHISFYHFTLVTDLAWFSSNTHQIAVIVLRKYFEYYRNLGFWRGLCMLVMGLFLAVCTGLTAIVPQAGYYNCPAECIIHDFSFLGSINGRPLALMIVNLLFLVWGYSVALGPLFIWSQRVRKRITQLADSSLVIMFNIIFGAAFFGLGLYELLEDRYQGQVLLAIDQSEDEMTFGQIVPLALLSLPILSALEVYCGRLFSLNITDNNRREEGDQ